MAERREIMKVMAISDDDCGMYRIGEIDTSPGQYVEAYIARHGEYGYQQMVEFGANLMTAATGAIRKYREANSPSAQEAQGS